MQPTDDFYVDRRWCEACGDYVPYLRSGTANYCTHCGGEVRLFSAADHQEFLEAVRLMPRAFMLRKQDRDRA